MNYKRISNEEVAAAMSRNIVEHDNTVLAMAAAGIAAGPMPVPFDPERPIALQIREPREGQGPEEGWCVHKWRFKHVGGAAMAAQDLKRLDPRLEVRIARAQ